MFVQFNNMEETFSSGWLKDVISIIAKSKQRQS